MCKLSYFCHSDTVWSWFHRRVQRDLHLSSCRCSSHSRPSKSQIASFCINVHTLLINELNFAVECWWEQLLSSPQALLRRPTEQELQPTDLYPWSGEGYLRGLCLVLCPVWTDVPQPLPQWLWVGLPVVWCGGFWGPHSHRQSPGISHDRDRGGGREGGRKDKCIVN